MELKCSFLFYQYKQKHYIYSRVISVWLITRSIDGCLFPLFNQSRFKSRLDPPPGNQHVVSELLGVLNRKIERVFGLKTKVRESFMCFCSFLDFGDCLDCFRGYFL